MQPSRSEISALLAWEPVPQTAKVGGGATPSVSLRLGNLAEAPPQGPPLAVSGIMQSSRAPPRARIGGLCLPLNSGKPGRAGAAAGETQRGERVDQALGLRGLSFPFGKMGTGADIAAGLGPTGPAQLRISTWEPHALARARIVAPGVLGVRSRGPSRTPGTSGQRDALLRPPRPQSPPPHSGGVGFGPPAQAPRPPGGRGSRGPGVVRGGAAGDVWAGGVALLRGDQGGGALLC